MSFQRQIVYKVGRGRAGGFTLLEVLLAVTVVGVMSALAVPFAQSQIEGYRMQTAVNMIRSQLNAAKMKSAAQGVDYQVAVTSSGLELNEKNSSGGFTQVVNTETMPLPTGVSFGFGTLTTGAGDGSEQASGSGSMSPVQASAITFNSMGLPVTSAGVPQAQNAIYVTDGSRYGAVTVSLGGRILSWYYQGSAWVQG